MDSGSLGTFDKSELIALIVALSEQNTALVARVAALEAKLNIPPKDARQLLSAALGRPEDQQTRTG